MVEALYHYCSTETFLSIISNRSIRLSSLRLSNDSMEGKYISHMFLGMIKAAGLHEGVISDLTDALDTWAELSQGLGFCLSEERDLLSQWRGYAVDGTGVAIGFSREYLSWFAKLKGRSSGVVKFGQVEYEPNKQESGLQPIIELVKAHVDSSSLSQPQTALSLGISGKSVDALKEEQKDDLQRLRIIVFDLILQLYFHKSKAFSEEREWRLLTHMFKDITGYQYRAVIDRLIPFQTLELRELERAPVFEVVLGPKHITPIIVVTDFLRRCGFKSVKVCRSAATYR